MPKTKTVNKSAKNGKFVPDKKVKSDPDTTYVQTVPVKKKAKTKTKTKTKTKK